MIPQKAFNFVLLLCVLTYTLGMFFVPLMDVDASQYASISREMLAKKSFLQVYDLNTDYLDKPPMLFWLSAASMQVFGVYDWAYRLPSFLFSLLAIVATYKLALLFYKKEIAQLAALVLATCQAMFLINHDVRTDTMLMGWVALSLWQLAAWFDTQKWKYFIVAFVAIAGGMLTKGPIALMIPVFAFVPHFILRREWTNFFKWHYLLGVIIIAILLVPMSIGLYQQYDMHPGKLINGVPINSGLRFYYWTQSFGRYTGENHFKELSYFSFLLENMLWSFMPWILFFLMGLLNECIAVVKNKFLLSAQQEWLSVGGFTITYCILARSQAQLPHYIFVVFPLAAIVTAKFLYKVYYTIEFKNLKYVINAFHIIIFSLVWVLIIGLLLIPFNIPKYVAGIAAILFMVMFYLLTIKKLSFPNYLEVAFFTIIGVNIFLNTAIYPSLLKYQIGNTAANVITHQNIDKSNFSTLAMYPGHSFYFYSQYIYPSKPNVAALKPTDIVLTSVDSLPAITQKFPNNKILYSGESFHITQLTLPFLNPATRDKELAKYAIVQLEPK